LGIRVENRLRWLLGDKSWVFSSADDLVSKLKQALSSRNIRALSRIMSRDFGFGSDAENRLAVNYHEGLMLIEESLKKSARVAVESISMEQPGRIRIKTSGWSGEHKVWYFSLHQQNRPKGWEWDLAYWEAEAE